MHKFDKIIRQRKRDRNHEEKKGNERRREGKQAKFRLVRYDICH